MMSMARRAWWRACSNTADKRGQVQLVRGLVEHLADALAGEAHLAQQRGGKPSKSRPSTSRAAAGCSLPFHSTRERSRWMRRASCGMPRSSSLKSACVSMRSSTVSGTDAALSSLRGSKAWSMGTMTRADQPGPW